jgi:hypothetical protein
MHLKALIPENEPERLDALRWYDILDTTPEQQLSEASQLDSDN